ncbi:WD repeat-containing protein, putative [Plasmodium chabaudi adami]|uniref:WD repeat-containing protein, putative n=1 Tax=Plasmodium chabaudi adami TaxID=5826 RepID=A0A1D3LL50_PLACE|nr:WD repeat-containing protein, putative [Plasmodium chabaudi adami]
MNDRDSNQFRDISKKIQGKYIPVIKFGGTNKYINKNQKNNYDDTNNISFTGDDAKRNRFDIFCDNNYGINKVCFSPQGKYIAGCGTNGIIYLYDLYENKLLTKLCTRIDNIRDLTISDNEKYIYACGDNKIIEIFDLYENRKVCNDNIGKCVDISIPNIIKNAKCDDKLLNTNNKGIHKNIIENMYTPYNKTKYKDLGNNKAVYVPIYDYNDLIKYDINMIDMNYVKLNRVNEIINKSTFIIKESHEYSTSCVAIPNVSSFLVYSGGGDGILKIWDIRMNLFALNKKQSNKNAYDTIFLDNKNPYASICSHEDVLTSISFNNTINYEGSSKLDKKKKKAKLKNKNSNSLNNSNIDENADTDDVCSTSSLSSSCSSASYSSLAFDLCKNMFNNILMTSGYDGYVRLYDINNNIIKSFYDEEKSITHCMFTNNNKYIISTNKSQYAKVFDFLYMNNKKNAKNMMSYLNNYESYYFNKKKTTNDVADQDKPQLNYRKKSENNFVKDVHNDNELHPCSIGNIYEYDDLKDRIDIINELNKKINDKKQDSENSKKNTNEKETDTDCSDYSDSGSSAFDENAVRTKTFYEHVNKQLEPTWSIFVDNLKYMDLIPYEEMHISLKENHDYLKAYYSGSNGKNNDTTIDSSINNDKSVIRQRDQYMMSENEQILYNKLTDIIYNKSDIPKFYSCISGDKCIIPSIDTYAHVYDIYTGLHVNTINNLYLPNYHIDTSYYNVNDSNHRIPPQKQISFLTSAQAYPKNHNIIATSNGYPDGSIVLWVFAPF